MFEIAGEIVKGLVSGIIEGINASKEKQAEISNRIVALLRTGADAVEAARNSFANEDAVTRAAFAAARERLTVPTPSPLPPAFDDSETKP
ncbi:MAG: hypothetical protein Q7J25_10270 [Vicinamibacterales bacterium]|nr:hypothetical protein [Vicinamibacterales bacterium]